jgi:hypothetical protein
LVSDIKGRPWTVFANRVLSRTFAPEREEIIKGWRKQHNEELHNMYCSPNSFMYRYIYN